MNTHDDKLIYLDHNATTPVDKEAAKIMTLYMTSEFGNPFKRLRPWCQGKRGRGKGQAGRLRT